ncbi:hypothetical protein CBL_00954 [Carabus blaptoides fortunei]
MYICDYNSSRRQMLICDLATLRPGEKIRATISIQLIAHKPGSLTLCASEFNLSKLSRLGRISPVLKLTAPSSTVIHPGGMLPDCIAIYTRSSVANNPAQSRCTDEFRQRPRRFRALLLSGPLIIQQCQGPDNLGLKHMESKGLCRELFINVPPARGARAGQCRIQGTLSH